MKQYYFFIVLGLVIALNSCTSDEAAVLNQSKQTSNSAHKISLSEALKRAEPVVSRLQQNVPTRSLSSRTIKSVEYFCQGSETRSSSRDTLFYVVNYNNNEGFTVLGADDRVLPVYAMSEHGQLNLSITPSATVLRITGI